MLVSKELGCHHVVKNQMKTRGFVEFYDFYEVAFENSDEQPVTIKVNANDSGIAVVEAYLYLRNTNPDQYHYAKTVQYIPTNPADSYDVEIISKASNILLSEYLTEKNKLLVACFISLCNEDSAADTVEEIEKELLTTEIACNTIEGTLYHYHYTIKDGAQLSIVDIKERCNYIWSSYHFLESIDAEFIFDNEFNRLRDAVANPEELLFWTFLMCLLGQYDCQYPYTLFLRIRRNEYAEFLDQNTYPAIRRAFIAD